MYNILTSFLKVAENENIRITNLEKKIGASKGVLSRAIANNTDIQAKWILSLVENYPRYNPEWLLTGKGSMLKGTAEPAVSVPPVGNDKYVELLEKNNALLEDKVALLEENKALLEKEITRLSTENERIDNEIARLTREAERLAEENYAYQTQLQSRASG
ncbi:MAG: hypothetical protein Q4G08_10565 [Capnocytophaga sp.]|nr:hypothetical protein [Capnocytophaga sp.]